MASKKDIIEFHKKQLRLKIDMIRLVIQHNPVKGAEAEFAFKRLLRKYLPQKYILSSGFVVNADKISHQHDIVIYDDFMNVPMYLGDNSGSFLGGAVYGVLETTIAEFNTKKLEYDVEKIAHLRKLFPEGKVAFQEVKSCPIVNEDEVKKEIEHSLSSGHCIDDIWPEMKEKCISKEGAFIGDVFDFNSIDDYEKESISCIVDKHSKRSKKYIVKEKIIYSIPPPRTYLCALDGTAYKSVKTLSKAMKRLTKKHGAHIHGLLVLNKEGNDWVFSTKAYTDYEVEVKTEDAFFEFLENMKRDFQGMLVGKLPAAEIDNL